jgi:hypothetical protein
MVFTDSRTRGRIGAVLAALMLLAAMIAISAAPVTAAGPGPGSDRGLDARTVAVQLLAINDFHGNI